MKRLRLESAGGGAERCGAVLAFGLLKVEPRVARFLSRSPAPRLAPDLKPRQ